MSKTEIKKSNKNLLIILVAISVLDFGVMVALGMESKIRYIPLILHMLTIIFCKVDNILPAIFFIRPNFGLYDACGFKLLFNFTVTISAIKLLVFKKSIANMDIRSLVLLVTVFLYNLSLTLINNMALYNLLTYITLFLSYIVLMQYIEEEVDFANIYEFYFVGMVMSFISGLFIPYTKFGFNIPSGFRFAAMMRDSNGYSLELLFLIITAPIYGKIKNKNTMCMTIILILFGLLGISKMFLMCLILVMVYRGITNVFFKKLVIKTNSIKIKDVLIVALIIGIMIYMNSKLNLVGMFSDKYIDRFNSTDLTSGRNEILSYYIDLVFNDPITLLFGRSLSYYQNIGFDGWAMAHNTWMELILSYGILGSIIYFIFIISVVSPLFKNKIEFKKEFILISFMFVLCLNALPILSGDALAILILYVVLVSKAKSNIERKI